MSLNIINDVYNQVIAEVIENMREEFEQNNVEYVLDELKVCWLQKLNGSGALPAAVDPYYSQPQYGSDFSRLYMQQGFNRPPYIPAGRGYSAGWPNSGAGSGGPYNGGSDMPQNDGPNDEENVYADDAAEAAEIESKFKGKPFTFVIDQVDGVDDDDDDEDEEDTFKTELGADDAVNEEIKAKEDDSPAEDLGSDLDDEEDELSPDDVVLCQFERVTRIKTKHKCVLKDGIMSLNGRDYLFHKANGEFDFSSA